MPKFGEEPLKNYQCLPLDFEYLGEPTDKTMSQPRGDGAIVKGHRFETNEAPGYTYIYAWFRFSHEKKTTTDVTIAGTTAPVTTTWKIWKRVSEWYMSNPARLGHPAMMEGYKNAQ